MVTTFTEEEEDMAAMEDMTTMAMAAMEEEVMAAMVDTSKQKII